MEVAGPEKLGLLYPAWFDFVEQQTFVRLADNISGNRSGKSLEQIQENGVTIRNSATAFKTEPKLPQTTSGGVTLSWSPVVKSDGIYDFRGGGSKRMGDESQQRYIQAVRLAGLTPEELRQGQTAEGLKLQQDVALTDPGLTVMSAPETFIQDLERLAAVNTEDMTEMELRKALSDTSLMQGYLAYQANQKSQGVSFDQFVLAQIQIMPYAGAPASSELITRLANPPKSTPNIPEDARPAGQENS